MEGPELFLLSADEAKSKNLHPSRRLYPDLIQPRAPMKSVWQARRKDAFAKDRKRIKEGFSPVARDPADGVSEESSDEVIRSKHKTPLIFHSTTSLSPSLDLKPGNPPNVAASSSHSYSLTHTDMKPTQSTDTLDYSPMNRATSEIDTFNSDDDFISSDDSIF